MRTAMFRFLTLSLLLLLVQSCKNTPNYTLSSIERDQTVAIKDGFLLESNTEAICQDGYDPDVFSWNVGGNSVVCQAWQADSVCTETGIQSVDEDLLIATCQPLQSEQTVSQECISESVGQTSIPDPRSTEYESFDTNPISEIRSGENIPLIFDLEDVEKVEVGTGNKILTLKFYDTSYQNLQIERVGVGYDFGDPINFEAPSILTEQYKAHFLCLNTAIDEGQQNIPGSYQRRVVTELIHNIPPQDIELNEGHLSIGFSVGEHMPSYCLLEISHIADPDTTVYAATLSAQNMEGDTVGHLRRLHSAGTFRVINQPKSEEALDHDEPVSSCSQHAPELTNDEIDEQDEFEMWRKAACDEDLQSIECLGYGYMIVKSEGTLTGERPDRHVDYRLICLDKNSSEADTCFENNGNNGFISESATTHESPIVANKAALWSQEDLSDLAIEEISPFRDEHFGYNDPDSAPFIDLMDADNLYFMKGIRAKRVSIDGNTYFINKCTLLVNRDFFCDMDKDVTALVAETTSTLDRSAKRFLVWKRVRLALAMTAGMMLGVGAISYYSAALTTVFGAASVNAFQASLVTLSGVGVAQGTTTLIQSAIQFPQCETDVCRVELAANIAESVFDMIDLGVSLPSNSSIVRRINKLTDLSSVWRAVKYTLDSVPGINAASVERRIKLGALIRTNPGVASIVRDPRWIAFPEHRRDILNILTAKNWDQLKSEDLHLLLDPGPRSFDEDGIINFKREVETGSRSSECLGLSGSLGLTCQTQAPVTLPYEPDSFLYPDEAINQVLARDTITAPDGTVIGPDDARVNLFTQQRLASSSNTSRAQISDLYYEVRDGYFEPHIQRAIDRELAKLPPDAPQSQVQKAVQKSRSRWTGRIVLGHAVHHYWGGNELPSNFYIISARANGIMIKTNGPERTGIKIQEDVIGRQYTYQGERYELGMRYQTTVSVETVSQNPALRQKWLDKYGIIGNSGRKEDVNLVPINGSLRDPFDYIPSEIITNISLILKGPNGDLYHLPDELAENVWNEVQPRGSDNSATPSTHFWRIENSP